MDAKDCEMAARATFLLAARTTFSWPRARPFYWPPLSIIAWPPSVHTGLAAELDGAP